MVGSEAIRIRPLKFGVQCSRSVCGFQNDAFGHFAEGDELPQGDQQLSGQRDDHRLADASSSVLRSRPVPAGQFAVGLEHQEPPGERDHSVSNARVACSGQPFLAAFYATFLWRSRQASIARQRPAIRYVANEDLARQHIGRVDPQSADRRELPNHGMMSADLDLRDLLLLLLVDLINLCSDDGQTLHGALNFGKGVRRDRPAFRREKPFEAFGSRLQMWFEAPNTETGERGFHRVDQLCPLADQFLAFSMHATSILFLDCKDRHHPAVIFLQPRKARIKSRQSRRSVFARRWSRFTGMVVACTSKPLSRK